MSYRNRRNRRVASRMRYPATSQKGKNYVSEQSGARRHQFRTAFSLSTLLAGEYAYSLMCRFRRSFSGSVNDVNPTATASNNYQTGDVMNGSVIRNFNATITATNDSASQDIILDVYTIALSFYDALIFNTVLPTSCPVTFDSTTVGPADVRGQVSHKAMTSTLITKNNYNNYNIIKHYMKHVGQIHLAPTDGGKSQVQFKVPPLPSKCKRSQTGMFYSMFIHNDSDVNAGATATVTLINDVSFIEIPTANRLPYVD